MASDPHAAPLQPAPENVHVTPLLALSFATVAVNVWLSPACTDAVVGATVTDIGVAVDDVPLDPPPQPFTKPATIASANTDRAARFVRTRNKAVSCLFVINFFQMKRFRGAGSYPCSIQCSRGSEP
jgi:hypothetical protein